jgi:uncharacterized protein (TIGR02300 family)
MNKENLGNKHVCIQCGCKFYDLKKAQPICPKCGVIHEEKLKGKKKQKAD